LLQVSIIPRS